MPLVTLPPSHSHHVIRMDPATQLKNRSILEVAYVRGGRWGAGGLVTFPAGSSLRPKTHASTYFYVPMSLRSPLKPANNASQRHASSPQRHAHRSFGHQRHQNNAPRPLQPQQPRITRSLVTRLGSESCKCLRNTRFRATRTQLAQGGRDTRHFGTRCPKSATHQSKR